MDYISNVLMTPWVFVCQKGTMPMSLRAGVCRPCDTIELTATICNFSLYRRVEKVCVDRQLLRYS